uniref:Uncharacterized protein n=1 Tax=Populus trichocarpa TaxID=3694 RepID=A0A3N7G7T2_POPTR
MCEKTRETDSQKQQRKYHGNHHITAFTLKCQDL